MNLTIKGQKRLGVMAMKEHSTFPKVAELEPYHQIQFGVIFGTHVAGWGVLHPLPCRDVIYEALCFDVAQGGMNETRTHLCRFASLAC